MVFVLEHIDGVPLHLRAEVYRDLAELASSPEQEKRFRGLAAECDELAKHHKQMALDLGHEAK